jgi:hypothetical protein
MSKMIRVLTKLRVSHLQSKEPNGQQRDSKLLNQTEGTEFSMAVDQSNMSLMSNDVSAFISRI